MVSKFYENYTANAELNYAYMYIAFDVTMLPTLSVYICSLWYGLYYTNMKLSE